MRLTVDFNMTRADGRIPALLTGPDAEALHVGDFVIASDGEGTECRAIISEISPRGYALLSRRGGITRDLSHRPSMHGADQDRRVTS
jgi:hypothetical protein